MDDSLNSFGGFWTQQKITIFLKYLNAYLGIMSKQRFKLIYFDGFAGCGTIENEARDNLLESVAVQVLSLDHEKNFDIYYLVDLDKNKVKRLQKIVNERFSHKEENTSVVHSDCNEKLVGMAGFLKINPNYRALAFIDPFGMSVNWSSLEACKELGIDIWILLPSGIGVNRLLVNDADISDEWLLKLENFLGMDRAVIKKHFYKENPLLTIFGEVEIKYNKEANAIKKVADLYCERLKTIWKEVSKPFPLMNSSGSVMYHFVFASNNKAGLKIANDIIGNMSKS